MKKFPVIFPDNFETEILPAEARCENKQVYRVIKSGILNRDAFLSTYEEVEKGLIPPKKNLNLYDPKTYSTSCFLDFADAEYMLDVFMRHYPTPFIARGITEATCGPNQLTANREKCTNSHLDWWIYDNTNPQDFFVEVKNDERELF